MNIMREWRHILMAKRAGRGHDPDGVSKTKAGGLVIACRACPQPGVNLPSDWASAPPDKAWLYSLILSQDANFCLKSRLRSAGDKDPSFGPGFAYFVENGEYMRHLVNYVDQEEVCTPLKKN